MRKILLFLILTSLPQALSKPGWYLRDMGDKKELVSPQAVWPIVGQLAPPGTENYYVEIPIRDLLGPEPTPTPTVGANGNSNLVSDSTQHRKETWDVNVEKEIKLREPASAPPRVVVEYDDSDRYVVEANRLFNRGKFYEATTVVEELLRKNPGHLRGWVMKGSLMHVQGQRDLARAAYEQALKLDPENTELKKMLEKYMQ